MRILAKSYKEDDENQYICMFKESELDKVTGVAGLTHIDDRYEAGQIVNISKIYNKVSKFNTQQEALQQAAVAAENAAKDIQEAIVLGDLT